MKIIKYSKFEYLTEEEGFGADMWQNIKYGISKLGRYKADGKIFGKGETDKKAAQEIGEIMGNTSNAVIKAAYQDVKKRAPEFPNDKSRRDFLEGIVVYGQLYDSLVAAAEKSPGEEGYLEPEVANAIIENLRKVVKKALDVDLAAVYSVMDSKNNIDTAAEDALFEEIFSADYEMINEEFLKKLRKLKDQAMDKMFGKEDEDSEQRISGSRQSAKLQGAGDNKVVDSERMKTLDSNKLPMILMGAGAALGALGWIASTDWFKDMVTTTIEHPAQYKTIESTVKDNLKVGKGLSYTIQDNGFMASTGKSLAFDAPKANLGEGISFYGNGNMAKGFESMKMFLGPENADASVSEITRQLADPSNKTVGDIFNKLEGTWGDGFYMNQSGGQKVVELVTKTTKRVLVKAGFKTTVTSVVGGKLIALAPVLGGLGIALIGAGIVVKLLREKGKRQSRAKTLNDLLQSLKLVTVAEKGQTQGQSQGQDSKEEVVDEKSIYPLMIKNLKALNSMIISSDGVELEGQGSSERRSGSAGREYGSQFEVGKKYIYINKEGEKKVVILVSKTHSMKKGNDKEWATGDDQTINELPKGDTLSVAIKGKDGKYGNVSVGVKKSQLTPVKESLLQEKQFTKGPRRSTITKEEDYLTQAVKNIRKSLKSLIDEKDKGVAITSEFVQEILDVKMSSDSKKPIKALYQEIYEYLYGKKSKTLSDFGPLYKESLKYILPKTADNPQGGKMDVVAEKVARLSKRTMQFEGEGFYSGLGEFGEDLKEFNETLKVIMEYCKSKSGVNESRIVSFKNFKA